MPSTIQHLRQVDHNKQLLQTFDVNSTEYLDWVVTIAFYTAVHLIEAYFADVRPQIHNTDHQKRQDAMRRVAEFKSIYNLYRELEEWSRNTRYKCYQPKSEFVKNQVLSYLSDIEQVINGLLDE